MNIKRVSILTALILLAACTTKKREAALPYGADRDLLSIAEYDGKEFDLLAKETISKNQHSSSDVTTKDETGVVHFFDRVSYQTDAALIDDAPFLGKLGKTYKVKYVLEGKLLKVYKIGSLSDFSFEERTAAETNKIGEDTWAAPLVSYNVSYYSTDQARNEYGDRTNRLDLIDQPSKENAIYFKIDMNSKQLAHYLQKDLLFDAKFFDADWYFATTIVNQSYEKKSGGDRTLLEWLSRSDAKVRAKKEETQISFYSLNIDKRLAEKLPTREENQNPMIILGASWKDYQMSPAGSTTGINEQERTERPWDQRDFVKIDASTIVMPTLSSQQNSRYSVTSNMEAKLRDVQIGTSKGRKYFSFKVYLPQAKATVRYAFLEAKAPLNQEPYQKKIYHSSDEKVFGFFRTNIDAIITNDQSNTEQHVDKQLLNRFNPALDVIKFHPSEQTPEWALPIAKLATESWNEAFAKAGSQTTIEFDPTRVNVGDIRYNVINIINDPDGRDPWWGFGPSIADSNTGEIVAATANLNISNMIQYTRGLLQGYLRAKQDGRTMGQVYLQVSESINSIFNQALGIMQFTLSEPSALVGYLNSDDEQVIPLFDKKNSSGYSWVKAEVEKTTSNDSDFSLRSENGFQMVYPNITKELENHSACDNLKHYASSLAEGNRAKSVSDELAIIEPCARVILRPRVANTLLHEIGHNLGLRHNFYGNNDPANFGQGARSSSIMEYPSFDESTLLAPGPYDIAAIKWGYNDELLAKDGASTIVGYKPTAPIQTQAASRLMKTFKYCSDENVGTRGFDPLCSRHDTGVSALETVENYIKNYSQSLEARMNIEPGKILKLSELEMGLNHYQNVFIPLKRFYDYYRSLISDSAPQKAYLETEDVKSFAVLLSRIENELHRNSNIEKLKPGPNLKEELAKLYEQDLSDADRKYVEFVDYQVASETAYQFLKTVAMMPDRYCVVQGTEPRLVAFHTLQKEVFHSTNRTITDCMDPVLKIYVAKSGEKVLAEAGYPVISIYRNLDLSKNRGTPIALGTSYDRVFALFALSTRSESLLEQNRRDTFAPNFFDEPQKRAELEALILDRMTLGLDSKVLKIDDKLKEFGIQNFKASVFTTERPLITLMYELMMKAEMVPGSTGINSERIKRFAITPVIPSIAYNDPTSKSFEFAGSRFRVGPENEVSYRLVELTENLKKLRNFRMPNHDLLQRFQKLIIENTPSSDQAYTFGTIIRLGELVSQAQVNEPELVKETSVLYSYVQPELAVFANIITPAMKEIDSKFPVGSAERSDAIEELKKTNISEHAKKMKMTKQDLILRFAEIDKSHLQKLKEYEVNKAEIDSQSEILLNSLIRGRVGN